MDKYPGELEFLLLKAQELEPSMGAPASVSVCHDGNKKKTSSALGSLRLRPEWTARAEWGTDNHLTRSARFPGDAVAKLTHHLCGVLAFEKADREADMIRHMHEQAMDDDAELEELED